jgi:putative endonuclease
MPFDFAPSDDRSLRGLVAYHDGLAAEGSVEAHYVANGHKIIERRWRGRGGEIDLILQDDDGFVFVEVKKAKTHAYAAERLSHRQLQRICISAEDYCGQMMPGKLVNMRVDLATVDEQGRVEVLPNISMF